MTVIRVDVPDELRARVAAFVAARGLDWELVSSEPCGLRVAQSQAGERRESRLDTLEAGGWIACATARALAKKHGITLETLGAFLNDVDVKVRQCGLGCF